jgi:Tol biopolymer transport system component
MAIALGRTVFGLHNDQGALLARVPLTGGAPREVAENVQDAAWGPDGKTLIVARRVEGRGRIEFPLGKVLYETVNIVSRVRLSPDGKRIGMLERDGVSSIAVMDLDGKNRNVLLDGVPFLQDLSWSPSGDELWFEGTPEGEHSFHILTPQAVNLARRRRVLLRVPGILRVLDTARDGRLLAAQYVARQSVRCLAPGESKERDLSWLDAPSLMDFSADGRTVLMHENLEGGGESGAIYLRRTDGSPAVRLGDGLGTALSPDGKWVLALPRSEVSTELLVLPTGAGESRTLRYEGVERYYGGTWFPDGQRILFAGSPPGQPIRGCVGDLAGGKPRAFAAPGGSAAISPDGKLLAVKAEDGRVSLYPVDGGDPRPVQAERGDMPIQWSGDGRFLYVFQRKEFSAIVYRLELAAGRRELWKEIAPPEPAGSWGVMLVRLTPDGKSCAYTYIQTLATLYLLEGVK